MVKKIFALEMNRNHAGVVTIFRHGLVALFTMILCLHSPASYAENPQLAILFESDWQWYLSHSPEYATESGDHRYNHRLSSVSLAASRVNNLHQQDMLREAKKINRTGLLGQELLSYDEFVLKKEQLIQMATMYPYMAQPITQINGLQFDLPRLVSHMPFVTAIDYHNYLSRLHAVPAYVDDMIEQLNAGIKAGWVAPKVIMAAVPEQLRTLRLTLESGELAKPFKAIPPNLPRPEVFAQRGNRELKEHVAPALKKLEDFIASTYLPACRDSIAISSLPGGMPYYDYLVNYATTTSMTTQELHQLGLSEVARIRVEMQKVMKEAKFKGDLTEFKHYLTTDPRFSYAKSDALLDGYRDIIRRANLALPTVFSHLPTTQIDVLPIPSIGVEHQLAGEYERAPEDGTRPAYFMVNVSLLPTRTSWGMMENALHEAVPGRHLQSSLALEAKALPAFRRNNWNAAFSEGWALYAASLADEMGLNVDAYSKFGILNDELLHSAGLVVDTGIHALGWSREQAVAYLNENTMNVQNDNEVVVDHYIALPGQALGAKIGQLKIKALRDKAAAELGRKFDLRAFHYAILQNGALPLSLLEAQIDTWISQQKDVH